MRLQSRRIAADKFPQRSLVGVGLQPRSSARLSVGVGSTSWNPSVQHSASMEQTMRRDGSKERSGSPRFSTGLHTAQDAIIGSNCGHAHSLPRVLMWRIGVCCATLGFLLPGAAGAVVCVTDPPTCAMCYQAQCNSTNGTWSCVPQVSGTTCSTGNACMSGEHCDGRGSCVGTLVCVPGAPGPITGPSTNDTGSYTISWGASSGVLDHYELWENNAGILSTAALSSSLSGKLAGSYTYTVRGCNSAGCSAFTAGFTVAVALPGVPGPISGPAGNNSTTGSYTLSWGASTGTVTRYELYENNAALFTNLTTTTATIPPRTDGTYTYNVRACSPTGCSAYTANYVVTVLLPPGTPGPISAPSETPPSYRVSWGVASGTIDHYDLGESADNGSTWGANAALTTTYKDFTAKPYGTYLYQVRGCNATACSVYVTASVRVTVITGLSAFADAPVVPPSVPIPDAGWVGTIPGSPDVEGGAATYKIPIEVPPGLNGM